MLWIDRGPDGSFYFGPFNPDPGILEVGIVEATSTVPQQTIKWGDIEQNFEPVVSPKLSFHPAQRDMAAQVHLRGFGTSGKKTEPQIVADWDVLLEAPRRLGLLAIPQSEALPLVPSGVVNADRDLVVPTAHFGAKAIGGKIEAVPHGEPLNVSFDSDVLGTMALFESSHGDVGIVIENRSGFRVHPPFFVLSLTSRGRLPYQSISIGFRRPLTAAVGVTTRGLSGEPLFGQAKRYETTPSNQRDPTQTRTRTIGLHR